MSAVLLSFALMVCTFIAGWKVGVYCKNKDNKTLIRYVLTVRQLLADNKYQKDRIFDVCAADKKEKEADKYTLTALNDITEEVRAKCLWSIKLVK